MPCGGKEFGSSLSIYPDPDQFRPERFLERSYGPFEFLPFGGSHRRCLGAALSDFEMRIALATIVFFTLIFAFLSGLRALRRPLRWITRLKFTIVTLSCLYLGWVLLFFHLIARPSRF